MRFSSPFLILTGNTVFAAPFDHFQSPKYLQHNWLARRASGSDANPFDLSHIKSWAALGDSYAAGIGAGKPLGSAIHREAWLCSRWDKAYPYVLNQAEEFGTSTRDFQFLACSGWTSTQIREKQVPKLKDKSQQLITLSSGGNDVYLSDLLDACVYQITPGAAMSDKCKEVMERTSDTIDKELGGWLDQLYTALKAKLTDDGKIYVTGYAQFWNSKSTQCNDVSWRMWDIARAPAVKLTQGNRQRMNELAVKVNNKIQETISKNHADKIVFVNIDPFVRALQGRFCEPGITEPNPSRYGALFYNRGTSDEYEYGEDEWRHTDLKRDGEVPKDSFEGSVATKFEDALREHPDWKMTGQFSTSSFSQDNLTSTDRVKTADIADTISSLLPDTFKRIFHPRPLLHLIMAQSVIRHIARDRAKTMNIQLGPFRTGVIKPENPSCKLKYKPAAKPRDLVCTDSEWRAPKEKTEDGSTPVMAAIEQFCSNRDGETAKKNAKVVYDRWDISGWGVTKRQSLWLRASAGPFSQCPEGKLEKRDCITVLTGGLKSCHQDSGFTSGFKAQGNNCIEYAVETSPSVHEGDPPWAEHVKKFPPPETLVSADILATRKHQIDCYVARGKGGWSWDDANAAIEQYCNNNLKNGGFSPPFAVRKGKLTLAATVQYDYGLRRPYADEEWCRGFDTNHKNPDDCRYAFRKIIGTRLDNHLKCYTTYRCVTYAVDTCENAKGCAWAQLRGIEDHPWMSDFYKTPVHSSSWNGTSSWNVTNSTAEEWYPSLRDKPSHIDLNSTTYVDEL